MEEIRNMMTSFRQNPPQMLAGSPILKVKDYQSLTEKDLQRNQEQKLDFDEKSNVLQFFTADGTKISVRPSGTEPKIKFYFNLKTDFQENTQQIQKTLQEKIKAIKQDLGI